MTVKVVEVGARDGLQNEARRLPVTTRVELLTRLADTGLTHLEAGAFVSARWVPQMADTDQVFAALPARPGVTWSALVPNERGLNAALAAGCQEVAVFAAASQAFSQRNINCSIEESLERFEPVLRQAQAARLPVRGYVSCALGCPYSGTVPPGQVAAVAAALYQQGCYEISLGDTVGAGTPASTRQMLSACVERIPITALAGHFHDTYGMAVANVATALEMGVRVFDSAVSGLGGCPYSPGATGNLATEDLVYLLDGFGLDHGIDLEALIDVAAFIDHALGRDSASRVNRALRAQRQQGAGL